MLATTKTKSTKWNYKHRMTEITKYMFIYTKICVLFLSWLSFCRLMSLRLQLDTMYGRWNTAIMSFMIFIIRYSTFVKYMPHIYMYKGWIFLEDFNVFCILKCVVIHVCLLLYFQSVKVIFSDVIDFRIVSLSNLDYSKINNR